MASNSDIESKPWITVFWNIENLGSFWPKDESISSPLFEVQDIKTISHWRLRLYPQEENREYILLHVFGKFDDGLERMRVTWDLALLADDDLVLQMKPRAGFTFRKESNWAECRHKICDTVMKAERKILMSQDTLRIRCRIWKTDENTGVPVTLFLKTTMRTLKLNSECNIEGFSYLESGHYFDHVIYWDSEDKYLTLFIGVNEEDRIIIRINSCYEKMKFLLFQSFVKDTKGYLIDCGKCEILPEDITKDVFYTLPFTKKHLVDNKNSYLKNDVLSLFLKYSWCDGYFSSGGDKVCFGYDQIYNKPFESKCDVEQCNVRDDLKEDLEHLYNEGTLTDVKICTSTQTFHAHKAILSARSPVFRTMFTTDMQEKIQERVDVPDVEDDTMRRMLMYAYSNKLEGLKWESSLQLYSAADKYEILTLKRKCSSFLKRSLSHSNVCNVLVLADMHCDDDLKKAAQDYVFENEVNIFRSDEWTDFTKNNATLAAETMLLKWKRKPE